MRSIAFFTTIILILTVIFDFSLAEESANYTWLVTSYVATEEPICESALVCLKLNNINDKIVSTYDVELKAEDSVTGEWSINQLKPGIYTLTAEFTTCSEKQFTPAELQLRVDDFEIRKGILVVLHQKDQEMHFKFLEANTEYDASNILRVFDNEAGSGIVIENISDNSIVRCDYNYGNSVEYEYLFNNEWGDYSCPDVYKWPEDIQELSPGKRMTLDEGYAIISIPQDSKRVKPSATRYKIRAQPIYKNHIFLGPPVRGIVVNPDCDIYYLQLKPKDIDWIRIKDVVPSSPEESEEP